MISWRKVGEQWAVQCDAPMMPGQVVTVTNRAGKSKRVTLGERVKGTIGFVYAVALAQVERPAAASVGDLGGVLALFAKARSHLKRPAIVLSVPAAGLSLRLSIAGPNARVPGSVTVLDGRRVDWEADEQRAWYGRILTDGTYQPSREAGASTAAIVARLQAFAAEPAKIAAEHGRLTGSCCFCNRALTDERSTAVGYGATCAAHYGLPWGERERAEEPEPTPEPAPAEPAPSTRQAAIDGDLLRFFRL